MRHLRSALPYGIWPRRALRLVAAGLFLMALVWQHVQATRLGCRVAKAHQRIVALRCANGTLRVQLESFLSPANLSAQARGRLGMSWAAPEAVRTLEGRAPCGPQPNLLQRLISRARRALSGSVPV